MEFKDLLAYKKGFQLAMEIFQISKSFPKEEKFALTSPIRKTSRMVCCNIAKSFEQRDSPELYFNQLTHSTGKISRVLALLQFAKECDYINSEEYEQIELQAEEVGIMIRYMILNPEKFGSRKTF